MSDERKPTSAEAETGENLPVPAAPPDLPVPAAPEERLLFTPPIDIYETEEGLVLLADVPGVSLKTLELQVQDNKLTLFGRVESRLPAGARLVHQEYRLGDFLRSFILSDGVDHDRINATLNNGVLKVVLPKSQQNQPRRIQVNTTPPADL